ncbi:hypothetical protein BGZ58_010761 [Dissophora ornata]|nr:hypothetical protein BGZ58_010761 [Dissophora ornata]
MSQAVLFFGNAGAGKSELLNQVGGNFVPGIKFRAGYTKDIDEQWCNIGGQRYLLMDAPGLYEPDENETVSNALKLTEALSKGYTYKLFFVLAAGPRGPGNAEMLMMARVNECVQKARSKASFWVIINQIQTVEMRQMYYDHMVADKCQSLLESVRSQIGDEHGLQNAFDIKIDGVELIMMFNKASARNEKIRAILHNCIRNHIAASVKVSQPIRATNNDLTLFEKILRFIISFFSWIE